jgi:hypothetical protein
MTEPAAGSTAVAEPEVKPEPKAPEPSSLATEGAPEAPKIEAKPEPEAKPETKAPPKPEAAAEPAKPEVFELEAPKDGLLTKEYVTQFQKDAIAAGLSKDEAKDLLDTQYRAVKEFDDRTKTSVETAKKQWREQSISDPEIGGDKLNRTLELSKRVVEKFGTPAFNKLLNETGFGNYPEVLKFLSKVGSAFSEDQLRAGNASSGGVQKSREEILFGGTTPT